MNKPRANVERAFAGFSLVVTTPLGVVSGLIVLGLSLITVVDVVARTMEMGSVRGALEVSEVLLVVGVFFAFGAAQASGAHVSTSVLTDRLPARARIVVVRVAASFVVFFLAVLVVAACQEAIVSVVRGDYRFGLVQMPLWPAKVAVAIGMIVYLVEYIRSYFVRSRIPTAEEAQIELARAQAEAEAVDVDTDEFR